MREPIDPLVAVRSSQQRSHRSTLTRVVLVLTGIALFLAFVSLGTWQVQRRAWKLELLERIDRRVHALPVSVPDPSQWSTMTAASHEYLPVVLQGRWLQGHSVLTQAVTELGAGFWLLTPLERADGTHVLINRGYVPAQLRKQFAQQIADAASPMGEVEHPLVTVRGLLRWSEPDGGFLRDNDPRSDQWHSRDVQAIAMSKGVERMAPFFVDQGLPMDTAVMSWPRPSMTVIHFPNNHTVYALTWYGLALMVLGAAWMVMRYEQRR